MTIEFKPIPDADLDAYFDLLNDKSLAANVASVPHPITRLWTQNRLLSRRKEEAAGKTVVRGLYENGILAGEAGYTCSGSHGHRLEIGYSIHRDHRCRGFATLAAKLAVQTARDHRKTGPIGADYFQDNPASGRVLEKAGFVRIGSGVGTSAARDGDIPSYIMQLCGDVALSALAESDYAVLYAQQNDEEAQYQAAGGKAFEDEAAHRAHLEKVKKSGAELKTILQEGHVAGYFASFDRFDKREISYWIGRDFCGKGIASKAVALWLEQMPLPAGGLYARVAKDHPASARVLIKNGFIAFEDDKYFSEIRDAEVEETLYKLGA